MGDESAVDHLVLADHVRSVIGAVSRIEAPMTVDCWSEKHMVIPRDTGAAEPGPYRLSRTPYAREVLRCLSETHPCRRVVVRAASQMLKTQAGLCFVGSAVHQSPSNMLILLPTERLTKRVSNRIAKTIKAVPVLAGLVAPPRSRDSSNTIDVKEYPGGTMYIVTAGSAANLAEIPARYVWGDEIDQWEGNLDGEGDPIELATKRTNTFSMNAKMYFCTSPRQKATSKVDRMIEQSTDRVYDVPCPHCDEMHELVWENMRWSDDRAWMVCPECGAEIEERHKLQMLARGQWRARGTGDGRTEGFTISALYMPVGWSTWRDLVDEYRAAEDKLRNGDDDLMRTFTNTRLAQSYESSGTKIDADKLKERAEPYEQRVVPDLAYVVTAAVDVQDDRLEYCAIAWGRGEESWVIDYGKIFGDPAAEDVWRKLDEWRERTFRHETTGVELPLSAVAIDTGGHHTHTVYKYCRTRESQRVYAVKGATDVRTPVKGPAKLVDVNFRGKIVKHGCRLWFVGVHVAKDLLAARLKLEHFGGGSVHFGEFLAPGNDRTYYDGLMSEERVLAKTARGMVWRWVKPLASSRNEPLDLLVYNLFAAHSLDMHTWKESDWDRRETAIREQKRAPGSGKIRMVRRFSG